MSHPFTDTLAGRKRLQQALNDKLGLVPPDALDVDGTLGPLTQQAITKFRQAYKVTAPGPWPYAGNEVDNELLDALGLGVAPITAPGTLGNLIAKPLIEAAIGVLFPNLKGLPIVTFLSGYKTYIIGAALILLGAISLLGFTIPGVPLDSSQGIPMIMSGIGLITGRVGAKQDVAKATGN